MGTTFKVFWLDDELRLLFEQLASTLATIAATETPARFRSQRLPYMRKLGSKAPPPLGCFALYFRRAPGST